MEIIGDICWAFSYISDVGARVIPSLLDSGVIPRIIQLMTHEKSSIAVPCLRMVGNILTGDDE